MAEKKKKAGGAYTKYKVSGESIERLNKTCPKCGSGVFMAKHKDRWACGNCKYTEMLKR